MRICTKCNISQVLENFSWRNKSKGTKHSWCKSCTSERDARNYAAGLRQGSKKEQAIALKKRNREYILGILKSSKCTDCGNNDIRVLEFDHLRDKLLNVSKMQSYSLRRVQEEIDKCEVVCANFHKISTYSRMTSCYRTL